MRDRLKVQLMVWIGVVFILASFIIFFFQPVGIVEINPEDINYVMIYIEFGLSGVGILILIVAWILHSGILKDRPIDTFRAPAVSEEERAKAEALYKERIESALNTALKKQKDITPNEILTAKEITSFTKEDFCMVCKIGLKKSDIVVQCPICESFYHKEHLLEWVRVKSNCPVCSQKLYDTVS